MDSTITVASYSSAGDKRKRDTDAESVERQPKVGTSMTRKESEVYQLIDSLGDLIDKNIKTSTGGKDGKDVSMYKKKNAELENKVKNLKAEIYDAKEALMQCKLEKEESKANAVVPDQLVAQVDELKKRVRGQKAQLAAALQSEKKLQEDVEQLRSEHAIALEASISAQNAYTEELVQTKKDLLDTQTKLTEQQKAYLLLTQQLQTENKTLQDALEKKIAEHDYLSKAFTDTKNMNEQIMLKSQPLWAERAQLVKQVETLTSQHEAYQVEQMSIINALTEEVNTLKSSLALANTEKDRLEKEKNEIELQFLRLKHGPVVPHSGTSTSSLVNNATNVNNVSHVVPTVPVAITFPSFPSTHSINAADDLSVLSDTTNHTDRRAASKALNTVGSPSRRVVVANSNNTSASLSTTIYNYPNATTNAKDFSNITIKTEPSLYNAILITTSQQVNIPIIRAEAAQFGNIISAYVLPSATGYKVEYDSPDDASMAVYKLNNRVIDGAILTVIPFTSPPPFGPSIPDSASEQGDAAVNPPAAEKIHLRLVFILHNAPEKYQITLHSLLSELKRYGEVVHLKRTADQQAFRAEFRFADDARRVIRNFVPTMNGFRIYCRSHFNHLPPVAVEPVSDTARVTENSPPPVILRDPVLSENRAVARERGRGERKPKFCQHCFDTKRLHAVTTHNIEQCFHAREARQRMERNGNSSSSSSAANGNQARERRDSPDRGRAPHSRGSDRDRDREYQRDRDSERGRDREREREASRNDRSRSSDQRSSTDTEKVDECDSLIVNGGVRPLSSKR